MRSRVTTIKTSASRAASALLRRLASAPQSAQPSAEFLEVVKALQSAPASEEAEAPRPKRPPKASRSASHPKPNLISTCSSRSTLLIRPTKIPLVAKFAGRAAQKANRLSHAVCPPPRHVFLHMLRWHARAHHRDHPHGIAARIADVRDHLIEVGYRSLARDGREFADRVGISVAPRLDNCCEGFARHA